nr:TonB-dependent receptor plug domain-containing protein [Moraxella sp. CTOTU48841]
MSKIQFFTRPTTTRFGGVSRQLPRVFIGVFSTFTTMAYAQTDTTASAVSTAALTDNGNDPQPAVTTLDTIIIRAEDASQQYAATQATTILKSDEKLFDSAKSVSVVTQNQLQQKQATTLADALKGVAGVTTGQYGRRGWDDIAIRGQLASSQILVDGMRTATSSNFLNSMDISGLESIEVVKGPDSVGFGQMMPGGVVNLTTKKPKDETFKNLKLSAGSNDFYQAAFDINYAPNGSTDGAFRLNGRVSDQNDPTDYVYFKNYYLAPSYRFALGDNTDVTLLASYQKHDYIRQQGLPLQNNAYKTYPSSLFFGEPNYTVQDERYSLGYQLNHDFDSGWRLKQNFALSRRVADADAILASGTPPTSTV